ncbi:MAG: anti-sigma factor domain-containing protein [Bacillota bacterium]
MQTCPRTDDAIACAFHQLSGAELASFQEHLAHCAACRLKLAEVEESVDLLAYAAPQVAPPPDLKQRVVRGVAAEAARRRPAWRRFAAPVAAAAAVLALALGTYSTVKLRSVQDRLAAYESMAPVQRSVALTGTEQAPAAAGRVVISREGDGTRVELQASGLPQLEPGQAYQLWLIKDGKRTSGGVFVIDATGKGGLVTWLPGSVEFDALGVTREPDAYGLQPRGTKVLGST